MEFDNMEQVFVHFIYWGIFVFEILHFAFVRSVGSCYNGTVKVLCWDLWRSDMKLGELRQEFWPKLLAA